MDNVSERKSDDLDDGWVLESKYFGEKESDIVSENDGNTTMLIVEMWAFLSCFFCPTPTLIL